MGSTLTREFHFYESEKYVPPDVDVIHGYREIISKIRQIGQYADDTPFVVHTTQMAALTTAWDMIFRDGGYRCASIIIHDSKGPFSVAPTAYGGCERTDHDLRFAHNILRMYMAGAFEEE